MVNYKVRSFYERDTGTAGADVIIYDDSGDVVDTLLITTESTYNDLVKQIEGIDEKYLDRTDVLEILQNTTNEIVTINATTLNGQSADFYAKNNHNHDSVYAPKSHVDIQSTEGVFGHAKIINNVSRGSFVNGEALSAYQGKLLSDRINTVSAAIVDSGWIDLQFSSDGKVFYVNYNSSTTMQYRKIGKIVHIRGVVKNKSATDGDTDGWELAVMPAGYRPSKTERQLNQGSSGAHHLVYVQSNGQLCIGARYSKNGSLIETPKNAWLNVYLTYFVD